MWPTNLRVVRPVFRSQRRRVLSHEDERANWPSDEMTTSETKWLWPWRIFLGKPKEDSSRVSCQTMMVLSVRCQRVAPSPLEKFAQRLSKQPFFVRTTRSGEDHVGVLAGGSDGSNPAGVAGKGSLENERLAHFVCFLVVVVWVEV